MAKEIDLILSVSAVPKPLKDAIDAHKVNYDALQKADKKMKDAQVVWAAAKDAFLSSEKVFKAELEKWEVK
jgi:hypothetical protein